MDGLLNINWTVPSVKIERLSNEKCDRPFSFLYSVHFEPDSVKIAKIFENLPFLASISGLIPIP